MRLIPLRMLLFCGALLALLSCEKDNPLVTIDPIEDTTAILQSDLQLKSSTTATFDATTRTVTMAAAEVADVMVGEVLLLSNMDNVGGRVLTKTANGDQVSMTLAELALTDVFSQCQLRFDTLMSNDLYRAMEISGDTSTIDEDGVISKKIGQQDISLPGGASLTGTLSFLPNFSLAIDLFDGSIVKFDAEIENPISYNFNLKATQKASLDKEQILTDMPVVFYSFTIGGVPFYIEVGLNVPLKISGSCEGEIDLYLNSSVNSEIQVGCTDVLDWDGDLDFTYGTKYPALQTIKASASAKAGVGMGLIANLRAGIPTTTLEPIDDKSAMCSAAATLIPYMRVAGTIDNWEVFFGADGVCKVKVFTWEKSTEVGGDFVKVESDFTPDSLKDKDTLYYTSADSSLFDKPWSSSWNVTDPGMFMSSMQGEVTLLDGDTLFVIGEVIRDYEYSLLLLKYNIGGEFISGIEIPTDDDCHWGHGAFASNGDIVLAGRDIGSNPAAARVTREGIVQWCKKYTYDSPSEGSFEIGFNSLDVQDSRIQLSSTYTLMNLDPASGLVSEAHLLEAADSAEVADNDLSNLAQLTIKGSSGRTLVAKAGAFGGFVTIPYNGSTSPSVGQTHEIGWKTENLITKEKDTIAVPTYATAVHGNFVTGYADQFRVHQISFVFGGSKNTILRKLSPYSMLKTQKLVDMGSEQAILMGEMLDSMGTQMYGSQYMMRWDDTQFRWAKMWSGDISEFRLFGLCTSDIQSAYWCGKSSDSKLVVGAIPTVGSNGDLATTCGASESQISSGIEYLGEPESDYLLLSRAVKVFPRAIRVNAEDITFDVAKSVTLTKSTN